MYLRRLELRGFKSFVTQASLDLDPGITAIVGPNGSGKSNVADALRWVLGEQSLRLLRGRKVQDVIWSGSAGRAPVGMAEVQLALDNGDGWLDIPYREVSIGRRIVRSGESDYLFNGARVRLRDVVELLAKGVGGTRGYGLSVDRAVLVQGAIDALLTLRPSERIAAFEDAAGVRPFQSQREDALRKLSAAQSNVQRLEDIADEIAARLPHLKRAADKARKHQLLRRQFAEVSGQLFRAQLSKGRQRLQLAHEHHAAVSLEAVTAAKSYDELQAQVAADAAAYELATHETRAAEQALRGPRSQFDELRRQADVLSERINSAQRQVRELDARIVVLDDKVTVLATRGVDRVAENQAVEDELNSPRSTAATTKSAVAQAEQAHEAASREVGRLRQQLSGVEREEQRRQQEEKAAKERVSAIKLDIHNLDSETLQVGKRLAGLTKQHETLNTRVGALEMALRDAETQRLRAKALLSQAEREAEVARTTLHPLESNQVQLAARRDALIELQKGLANTPGGHDLLWRQRRSLPDLGAPVTTLIRVPTGLEKAAQVIFGATLEALTASTLQAAISSVELAAKHQASATILAMDEPMSERAALATDVMAAMKEAAGEGWVGYAADMIVLDGPSRSALAAIVAGWVVVQGVDDARKVVDAVRAFPRPISINIVTKAGVGIQANGLVFQIDEKGMHGYFGRAREIDDLDTKLITINQAIAAAHIEIQKVERRLVDLVALHSEADRHVMSVQGELRTAQPGLLASQRQLDQEAGEELGRLRQRERLLAQMAQAHQHLHQLPARPDVASIPALRDALSEAAREADARRTDFNVVREKNYQFDLIVARAEQRRLALDSDVAREEAVYRDAEQELARLRTERHSLSALLATTEERLRSCRLEIAARQDEARQAEARLVQADEKANSLRHRWQQNRSRESDLRARWMAKLQLEETASSASGRAEAHMTVLAEQIQHELGVSVDVIDHLSAPLLAEEKLKQQRGALAESLRQLGNVNLDADQEYADLSERHQHMRCQIDDLKTATTELTVLSDTLRNLIDRQFRQVFDTTSEAFTRYFKRLLNGGEGRLCLNHDESGAAAVDISVRLPGKRGQDLAVLSGGERAMVATALLFAMIEARPTPFCLLDEADASLDDANVDRFCELLRELTRQTQFIVITHNRATMQAADALYGVTMDRDGASRIVSWRLSDPDLGRVVSGG